MRITFPLFFNPNIYYEASTRNKATFMFAKATFSFRGLKFRATFFINPSPPTISERYYSTTGAGATNKATFTFVVKCCQPPFYFSYHFTPNYFSPSLSSFLIFLDYIPRNRLEVIVDVATKKPK